ncbi:golgin subfamily A member 6-like protein 25 [Palaemon carinicauda]|uniref:golgin subfamily A member 6-like protein 25 n=1 Tax=Palaemon carinicauda TaxID=392227 RepID=UPI0035B5DA40
MKHLGKKTIDQSIRPVEICPKTKLSVYSMEDLLPFVGRVIKRGEFGYVYELVGKYSNFCLKVNRIGLDVELENLLRFQHLAVPKVMGLVKEWVVIVSRHQMTLWDWARIMRPTKEQVLRILIALAGILQDFHAEGYCLNYVHPESVMIDSAPGRRVSKVSVMDLNIMKEIGANPFQRPIVQTSQSSGANTKNCKCFAPKILAGEGGTPQTDALSMALTIGFLVSNGVLKVRSPFRKLLDWFAGCYGNESGCSMDTLLIALNKELDNCPISEMEEWVADQKGMSSLESSTSNGNDDEEEGRKDCHQDDHVTAEELIVSPGSGGDTTYRKVESLPDGEIEKSGDGKTKKSTSSEEGSEIQALQEIIFIQKKELERERETKCRLIENHMKELKEVYDYQQKLGEIEDRTKSQKNEKISNLDHDLLQRDQGLASLRQQADHDKRKNDEMGNKKLSLERKFQEVQEENDSLRKEVGRLRESQLHREEDKLSRQGFQEEQKTDLEGKPQDERKHLRREAKDAALIRIRQIAQDEISQPKSDRVYASVQPWEEALKDEKTENKQKVNLEEIEEGIVKRRIQYFENIIRGNIKEEGDLCGQSPDFRKNLNRKAKDIALARITRIIQEELSEQKENVWNRENIEKELKDYQEENSAGTDGDSASKGDYYAKIRMVNAMGEKQKADLEGKPQDERKHLRREAKDVALIRIRQIAQDEISQPKSDKVYASVQPWEEALKDEKTENKPKVNLEKVEEGIVKRRIQYFENIIRGNIKEEGDLRGQSPDFKEHLNRKAKDIALARITRIIQEELSEELNENVWKSENIEKELQDYQEANSPGTKADSASKGGEYAEIMMMNGIMKRKHLRREAKDVALIRIRQIAQEEISQQKGDKVYALIKLWEEALKHEKTDKRQKVNLEEIEEGLVERGIQYFENNIRGIIVSDCCQAIEWGLQGVGAHEELSEQNENVWKSENIEKELQNYQEANSPGTQEDSANNSDDYEEIIKIKVMGRKQIADLRRKAKDKAFFKIRRIAMEEVFPENRGLVYGLVQVWEEALKGENIEKMKKVIHEVIEKGNVKRHIQKFENAIRGNLKEGDLRGQPRDFRNHLRRTTKDKALAQIRKLVQEDMSEKRGRVYDLTQLYENAIKGDKIEKKSKYKAIKSQTLEDLIEYFENMLQENTQNEGHLHGQYRDLGNHLRRAAKDVALARIRNILQEAIEEENFEE